LANERSFAVVADNDLGGATNGAPGGTLGTAGIPYKYTLLGSSHVAAMVPKDVGAILKFEETATTNGTVTPARRT
jgi:pectate lyase